MMMFILVSVLVYTVAIVIHVVVAVVTDHDFYVELSVVVSSDILVLNKAIGIAWLRILSGLLPVVGGTLLLALRRSLSGTSVSLAGSLETSWVDCCGS
jgi:hypothetical protein